MLISRLQKKGFTLIELLVVISILGILVTLIIGRLGDARESARVAKFTQEIDSFQNALELYSIDNNQYPFHGDFSLNYYYIDSTNPSNSRYYEDLKSKMEPYIDLDAIFFGSLPQGIETFYFYPVYNPVACPNQKIGNDLQTYALVFDTYERVSGPYGYGNIPVNNNSPILDAFYVDSMYTASGRYGSSYLHSHCVTL